MNTGGGSPILEVNNIEVVYNKVVQVLRGLSLAVPRGQIVALLGSNGAGKSTTLKAVSGLLALELMFRLMLRLKPSAFDDVVGQRLHFRRHHGFFCRRLLVGIGDGFPVCIGRHHDIRRLLPAIYADRLGQHGILAAEGKAQLALAASDMIIYQCHVVVGDIQFQRLRIAHGHHHIVAYHVAIKIIDTRRPARQIR